MPSDYSDPTLLTDFEKSAIDRAFKEAGPTETEMNAQERLGYSDEEAERLEGVRGRRRQREARDEIYDTLRESGRSRTNANDIADKLVYSTDVWDKQGASTVQFDDGDAALSTSQNGGGSTIRGVVRVNGVLYNADIYARIGDAL